MEPNRWGSSFPKLVDGTVESYTIRTFATHISLEKVAEKNWKVKFFPLHPTI